MKIKSAVVLSALLCFSGFLFAQNEDPLKFHIVTDVTYSPATDYVPGDTHFAPITGAYSGFGARTTFNTTYRLPTPLGENFLLNGAHLDLNGHIELSPVTIKGGVQATFSPLPFLEFQAGGELGSGWNLGGIKGIAFYNGYEYEAVTPFSGMLYKAWLRGLFQFDTGAIWSGNWTHVVMQYTYQAYYHGFTGTQSNNLWGWQADVHYLAGWCSYQCAILAYQMPLVLYRIGGMFEAEHNYNDKNLNPAYKPFNGAYNKLSISPIMQFKFGSKDTLSCAFTFASRRSFGVPHNSSNEEPKLTTTGTEWYFKQAAFSWTHNF